VTKVLYVEDNDDNVFMLKMRLELLGDFEVLTAEDGEKGCEMAAAEQPDIILMDLEMPVVDGWEATRRLKGNPQTREIPIIALSAHALAGEREKALAAGCNEFDTKPSPAIGGGIPAIQNNSDLSQGRSQMFGGRVEPSYRY